MVNDRKLIIYCLILLESIAFASSLLALPSRKIQLYVGDKQKINIAENTRINISKKGIVDIIYLSGKSWQLVGIKEGFVLIKVINNTHGSELVELIYINIIKRRKKRSNELIPEWICQLQNVKCNLQMMMIEGVFAEYETFIIARKICERIKSCSFFAVLSQEAMANWRRFWKENLNYLYDVLILSQGVVLILVYCPVKDNEAKELNKAKKLIKLIKDDAYVAPICLREYKKFFYDISAKVILVEKTDLNQLGLFDQFAHSTLFMNSLFRGKWHPQLKGIIESTQMKVVGEPRVKVQSGVKAKVQVGGEFALLHKVRSMEKDVAFWKSHGLRLEFIATPNFNDQYVHLQTKLSLKSQLNKSGNNMSTHAIESSFVAELSKPCLVGSTQLEHQHEKNGFFPFLRKIPIIAPIFRQISKGNGHSSLYLYLNVSRITVADNHSHTNFIN